MLFNSPEFLFLFLPIVLAILFLLGRKCGNLVCPFLIMASLVFYAWWSLIDTIWLILSVLGNFSLAALIRRAKASGRPYGNLLLYAGIAANLFLLGAFKYAPFICEVLGIDAHIQPTLPLGISFFTFTQIAFLIHTAREETALPSLSVYTLFVTFFPHLIAGPVYHHREMFPQFTAPGLGRFSSRALAAGLTLFAIGLAKKMFLADPLAQYVSPVFVAAAQGQQPAFLECWGAALAYSFQLYFDFSGYMDMAAGIAAMIGIRLPMNFFSPYKAANISDFWRRWHMTLSRFFRDYVYIPLGGNRCGALRKQWNLLMTMILCGLWHGGGWTFILWGALHGVFLVIHQGWRRVRQYFSKTEISPRSNASGRIITFLCVVAAWTVFRAEQPATAWAMVKGLAGFHGLDLPAAWLPVLGPLGGVLSEWGVGFKSKFDGLWQGTPQAAMLALSLAICWAAPNSHEIMARYAPTLQVFHETIRPPGRFFLWAPRPIFAVLTALVLLGSAAVWIMTDRAPAFLYFRF
jgi:alginate O-acetyltransferase complex protein AlgI